MFKTLLLAFLLFLVIDSAAQQDTILFMNGQIQPCKILSSDGTDVTFEFKKRKKLKVKNVHKSELFGIVEKGERSIYYTMNAIVGDDLSVQEVEIFMAGQRDAKDNFNVVPVWLGGLSFGVLSGILGKSNFILIAVPIITYPLAQYIPIIKIDKKYITNPNHRYNELYAEGFERVARGKKIGAALKSSALGTFIGAVFYRLVLR